MSAPSFMPIGADVVLFNVRAGRSAWAGWEGSHGALTAEGHDAYAARAAAIRACREAGLLDNEGLLTATGTAALRELEAAHG
ncbi:MAG: hypothetical protein JHC96_05715 [Brevundimonas sp.]|uniref:hypothetical protein n=1 Tax=Brevundimonas sp. TaxID=1871086 RepID=UPI001A234004|nr:hypothetical protein [Brevundimonas sp.]MBJ7318276.1 hypothetical protein [Brevundimonas sp.]